MVMAIVRSAAAINRSHWQAPAPRIAPGACLAERPGASSAFVHQPAGGSHRNGCAPKSSKEDDMPESVYKVIELVGTSTESWEKAATVAVERASKTLRDLRVAEVVQQDLVIEDGTVRAYRAKLNVSFKYED
jgi:flavin-binding protein dodecin